MPTADHIYCIRVLVQKHFWGFSIIQARGTCTTTALGWDRPVCLDILD